MFKIVEFSHLLISEYIKNSNLDFIRALDATCGNGFDTLFIANELKDKGSVDAYDIQLPAINHTKELLTSNNISNVTLIHNSHEFINPTKYDLAVFNLGYLPTYDKTITTKKETTISTLSLLVNEIKNNPNLVIIVSIYPGHEEGKQESIAIDEYVYNLPSKEYLVTKFLNYNRPSSPYIITISKNKNVRN